MRQKSFKGNQSVKVRKKHISLDELIGPEWADIFFGADGLLYLPGWRRGFTRGDLHGIFYNVQELASLRHDNNRLKQKIERMEADIEVMERDIAFYKRQIRLEASWGMMLARIAS